MYIFFLPSCIFFEWWRDSGPFHVMKHELNMVSSFRSSSWALWTRGQGSQGRARHSYRWLPCSTHWLIPGKEDSTWGLKVHSLKWTHSWMCLLIVSFSFHAWVRSVFGARLLPLETCPLLLETLTLNQRAANRQGLPIRGVMKAQRWNMSSVLGIKWWSVPTRCQSTEVFKL